MHEEELVHFCTRMAHAIAELFLDPDLDIPWPQVLALLTHQRWINMIFASSPYVNADHVLRAYNQHKGDDGTIFIANNRNAYAKYCILLLPESNINPRLDAFWSVDPTLCAGLCFALESPRFIGTEAAFGKRAEVLQWFPKHLEMVEHLEALPINIAHDVYMHCSYDLAANKHDVKRPLNHVIRRFILQNGWKDRDVSRIGLKAGKPVMAVLLEHFNANHSIYRTHSTSMIAAREHFHLVGFGNSKVDQVGRAVFDEFHELQGKSVMDQLGEIKAVCDRLMPAVFYMPSVGMDLTAVFASNVRLAPIQALALGHPATTHSDFMQYVIVEDDYVGSEECFSEKLIRLPKDALPYVQSGAATKPFEYILREKPEVVQIGVAASTMKLNPAFLTALRTIAQRAKVKVHFHFALASCVGITYPYLKRFVKRHLGELATVHPQQPYLAYMETLRQCDMLVNPFPFGNTNGIIDMVTLGLVGICKTGPEVHEHIDEGLFRRLGVPEWMIARTVDDYIVCAVRLAENHAERLALRRQIIRHNGLKKLFTGDPRPMGNAFREKVTELTQTKKVIAQAVS